MERVSMLKSAALICAATITATSALAQDSGGLPFMAQMSRTFGPTGLVAELGQEESYGSVQTRQSQSRAQIAAANADGIWDGYEDVANKMSVPVTLSFSLPNNAGLRVRGSALGSWADENMTYADSAGFAGLVEYLHMPGPNTLLGYGLFFGDTDVDIQHNGGTIDASNVGLRVDLLHNLNSHWGIAGRVLYRWNDTETVIPLGFADLETDQGSETFYTEWTLVGNYEHEDASFVPEGWLLRPRIRALYTRTSFDTVTNSLGGTNEGTVGPSDEYATIQTKLRLLQPVFRPGQSGFYAEAGVEQELINDLDLVVDDPTILLGKVGYTTMFNNGFFLDASYGMERGTQGLRDQNALTLVMSKTF